MLVGAGAQEATNREPTADLLKVAVKCAAVLDWDMGGQAANGTLLLSSGSATAEPLTSSTYDQGDLQKSEKLTERGVQRQPLETSHVTHIPAARQAAGG